MIGLNSKSLIPFIMVGYPSYKDSLKFAKALIDEGASVLELGVPFSDPMADGPVIQQASEVALKNGIGLKEVFEFIRELNRTHSQTPLVLFTYFNPIYRYGLKRYTEDAKKAGVAATLTVDLPPEEALDYVKFHNEADLKTVFLASPTTTVERLKKIDELSTGFIYYISRLGVTGEAQEISATLEAELKKVRDVVKKPIAVGFGISNPQQAAVAAKIADAVVIGSRYLRLIDEGEKAVRNFTRECMSAMKEVGK